MRSPSRLAFLLVVLLLPASLVRSTHADDLSAFGRLLNAGLPESRLPGVLEFIGKRGTPGDLALVLRKAVEPDGLPIALRPTALAALELATNDRNVQPAGDLSGLANLITGDDVSAETRAAAVRLAGRWKVESVGPALVELALAESTSSAIRTEAIEGLAGIGGDGSRTALEKIAASDRPLATRYSASAALVSFDVPAAAKVAAAVLADADGETDPAVLISAFLDRPGASDVLAAALADVELPIDVAKMGLRYIYSIGRNDAQLVGRLSEVAGITTEPIQLSPEEMLVFTKEVLEKGDADRGEAVFRRADLSCFKCHALRGAGGKVGPDLSGVGSSSPIDYVARAVLDPDKDIKEVYRTASVVTEEGRAYHGIVVEDTNERLVLREATGRVRTFPLDTLDDREEGGSLMPKGLAGFMTRSELVDLVRFLSELGRPGGNHAPTNEPTIQRWRFLANPPRAVADDVPNDEIFSATVHEAELPWVPFYARFNGDVPMSSAPTPASNARVHLFSGGIEVSSPGKVTVTFEGTAIDGLRAWVDGESYDLDENDRFTVELDEGVHTLYVRVPRTTSGPEQTMRVTITTAPTSSAVARPLGGA